MYIGFDDPQAALEEARRLVAEGRWQFQEDALGLRHAYARLFEPGKDPTLRRPEVAAVFLAAQSCVHEKGSREFFRVSAHVHAIDWEGTGRILFQLVANDDNERAPRILIVTAFREHGWTSRRY